MASMAVNCFDTDAISNTVRGPIGISRSTSAIPSEAVYTTAPFRITITDAPGAWSLESGARSASIRFAGSAARHPESRNHAMTGTRRDMRIAGARRSRRAGRPVGETATSIIPKRMPAAGLCFRTFPSCDVVKPPDTVAAYPSLLPVAATWAGIGILGGVVLTPHILRLWLGRGLVREERRSLQPSPSRERRSLGRRDTVFPPPVVRVAAFEWRPAPAPDQVPSERTR